MVDENTTKIHIYLGKCLLDCIEDEDLRNIKILLSEKNANPNTILPSEGGPPLHLAIAYDKNESFTYDVVEMFLKYGGDPNLRCGEVGLTPVHVAISGGKSKILFLLLKYNGDVFMKDTFGNSALEYAKQYENCEWITEIALLMNSLQNGSTIHEYLQSMSTTICNKDCDTAIDDKIDELTSNKIFDNNSLINLNDNYSKEDEDIYETAISDNGNEKNAQVCDKIDNRTYNYLLTDDCSENDVLLEAQILKNHSIYKNYILSPIPFCTTTNSIKKQDNSTNILSPIQLYHTKSNADHTKTLMNFRNDYKTPMNYIFYNSKIHPEITLDNSFESYLIQHDDDCENSKNMVDDSRNCTKSLMNNSKTILAMSEEHKYTDIEQGVELIERRYLTKPLVLPADESGVGPLLSDTNEMTFDLDIDYDTDTLRNNLTKLGYQPGPITHTTKRVYLKKLVELCKFPSNIIDHNENLGFNNQKVYSAELQKTLQDTNWQNNFNEYIELEKKLTDYFENNCEKKLRGGNTKSSFTYLLLDPRITLKLPLRASQMDPLELWKTFLHSIFYVGKGKRSRPYAHLYEAITVWKNLENLQKNTKKLSGKIQQILDIWRSQQGVICLHIFQNILPAEAYTREAAMIQVIGLNNLRNLKNGQYYGNVMNWRRKEKCLLGVYLLYKAMQIFLNEGERQLRPADID